MATYMVRVEIFGAGLREYDALHEAMKLIDFSRTVRYPNGEVMALPTGTYVGVSLNSAAQIREKVRKLADPLSSKTAAVFVCQYGEWAAHLYPASASTSAFASESE
ncbi:type V toxin-antitoxin system endoribonuclease antitoxin GhoS [Xenorhabdus hominickii]|uniref:Phage protein n=1 Tax=Xenorhabdus hominickii TaxID=351679 RepID=A0A2G0Q7W5_XENHO|nr:type V toxin-antitoxin system endoribonuclease antitoxin GhoS [Xenorhabdus hominickii]AOM41419.1 hypothetical protein A9255_12990 [Xenorhabdus hominickii]PHM55303.1 hypothetical protein Xhom_02037 [Xenorhabdus hominickii]PHM57332.1 hypothetical protein Xhom_00298 [Xenorhabdus hominickii]